MWPPYHTWQRVQAAAPQNVAPFPKCSQNPIVAAEMHLQPPAVLTAIGNQVAALQACKPASPHLPRSSTMVVVPSDPGNITSEGTHHTTTVTPPTHPATTREVQVMQVRQNKNLYYSLIDWKTKEKPLSTCSVVKTVPNESISKVPTKKQSLKYNMNKYNMNNQCNMVTEKDKFPECKQQSPGRL